MFAARIAHKIIVTPILEVVALDYTNCDLKFGLPSSRWRIYAIRYAHARGAQGRVDETEILQ